MVARAERGTIFFRFRNIYCRPQGRQLFFRMTVKNIALRAQSLVTKAFGRVQIFVLIIMCAGILLAYLAGMYLSGSIHAPSRWMGALLACSSVVAILQKRAYKDSLKLGITRVAGTFTGALVAYLYLLFFHFTVEGMLISVFILEMLFMLFNIYNNSHIATITLLTILLVSQQSPDVNPAMNCLLRFTEAAVGVGSGVALMWVIEKWNKVWQRVHKRIKER